MVAVGGSQARVVSARGKSGEESVFSFSPKRL